MEVYKQGFERERCLYLNCLFDILLQRAKTREVSLAFDSVCEETPETDDSTVDAS